MFDVLRDNWTLLLIGQYPHGPIGGIVVTILLSVSALAIAIPLSRYDASPIRPVVAPN